MIIGYDKNPALSEDQKLQRLVESVQLAFNELKFEVDELRKEIEKLKEE